MGLKKLMFRGRIPIFAGSAAVVLGVLLLAWVNESSRALPFAEIPGFVLFPGVLAVFAGSILFCVKEEAGKVLLAGAVVSGVSLVLVPLFDHLAVENVGAPTFLIFCQ
jgi:hypothetical protein